MNGQQFKNSSSISISYVDDQNNTIPVANIKAELWIPRSVPFVMPPFTLISTANMTLFNPNNQMNVYSITANDSCSAIFIHLKPVVLTVGYLIAFKFGDLPFLNDSLVDLHMFEIFCPDRNLTSDGNDSFYAFHALKSQNTDHSSFYGYGIRELSLNEFADYCLGNKTASTPPVLPNQYNTSKANNYHIRNILGAASWIDRTTGLWSCDGTDVESDSNSTHMHITTTHFTEFAAGMVQLPPAIDFKNVWASAGDFLQNLTIYLTVITVSVLYIILAVFALWMDRRDAMKSRIHWLSDNFQFDSYFYEMIVFTGSRRGAATHSNVTLFSVHVQ